jgi:hypothetical protein
MVETAMQLRHPGGRPRLTFDLRMVEDLGKIQSTHRELASVLGASVDTVERRLLDDPEFRGAYEKGVENGRSSLRRLQWKAASGGNIAMMIWLGKQYLGQREPRPPTAALSAALRQKDAEAWEQFLQGLTDEQLEAVSRIGHHDV